LSITRPRVRSVELGILTASSSLRIAQSANCHAEDTSILFCTIVFGSPPGLVVKPLSVQYLLETMQDVFLLPKTHEDYSEDST